jgi:Zn-dependent M16 (insulinase) family peptidase
MSSPTDQLWHGMSKYLFEETTYHHNSGGDPEKIIDLTHADLVAFHQKHYHPRNATFFTFGNVSIDEVHSHLEENVFQKILACPRATNDQAGKNIYKSSVEPAAHINHCLVTNQIITLLSVGYLAIVMTH